MIEKAIREIDSEVEEIATPMAYALGELIKQEILTSDINAAAVMSEDKSLEDLLEKINNIASNIHKGNYKDMETAQAATAMFQEFTGDVSNISAYESPDFLNLVKMYCVGKSGSAVAIPSTMVTPLIYAYFGILPGDSTQAVNKNSTNTRPSGFKRICLD